MYERQRAIGVKRNDKKLKNRWHLHIHSLTLVLHWIWRGKTHGNDDDACAAHKISTRSSIVLRVRDKNQVIKCTINCDMWQPFIGASLSARQIFIVHDLNFIYIFVFRSMEFYRRLNRQFIGSKSNRKATRLTKRKRDDFCHQHRYIRRNIGEEWNCITER